MEFADADILGEIGFEVINLCEPTILGCPALEGLNAEEMMELVLSMSVPVTIIVLLIG